MDTENLILICLRSIVFVAGFLTLYAGLFLYPDERKQLQNYIEDWWLRIDDSRKLSMSRFSRIIRASANSVSNYFDKNFGAKIITGKFFLLSFILSSIAFMIGFIAYVIFADRATDIEKASSWMSIIYVPVLIGLLIQALKEEGDFNEHAIGLIVTTILIAGFGIYYIFVGLIYVVMAWFFGIFSDVFSLLITRKIIKSLSMSSNIIIIIGYVFIDLVAVACLLALPIYISYQTSSDFYSKIATATSLANITNIIPSFCYLFIGITFTINYFLWNSILRPLYTLIDVRVFEKRKALTAFGIILLTISILPEQIKLNEVIQKMIVFLG